MKTSIKLKTIVFALFTLTVLNISAQSDQSSSSRAPGIRYSVGVDGGIPVADLKNYTNWMLGGSLQTDFPISKDVYITGNAGYDHYFAKDGVEGLKDLQLIPVKAGIKYFPFGNLYVQGGRQVFLLM